MSQVNKIDGILNKIELVNVMANPNLRLGVKIGGKDEAKQALPSAILEVKAESVDDWEQAIKDLFGENNAR